jgi:hypothetical protein
MQTREQMIASSVRRERARRVLRDGMPVIRALIDEGDLVKAADAMVATAMAMRQALDGTDEKPLNSRAMAA